jgi:hypothetical protein
MPPQLPWRNLCLLITAFAVASEIALRLADFEYPSATQRAAKPPSDLYVADDERLWRLKAATPLPWASTELSNARGMRGPQIADARDPNKLRIAILGSADAMGVGVPWEEAWFTRFAQALQARGMPTELCVAAYEGATIRMSLELWRRDVAVLQPDLVLLCHAGTEELQAAPLAVTDTERLANPKLYQPQASWLEPVRNQVRLGTFAAWLLDIQSGEYWDWQQRSLNEQRLRPAQETFDVKGVRRVLWTEFYERTRQLTEDIRSSGAKVILFPIPGEPLLRDRSPVGQGYHSLLEKLSSDTKVALISARAALLAHPGGVNACLQGQRLNAEGHRVLAEALDSKLGPRAAELKR